LKTILKNIAGIQTGLFAKTVAKGDIVYLQAKHFDEQGRLVQALHPDLTASASNNKHLLQPGDLLFAAKGNKNFAAVYEIHNQPCIASTSFFVIRLTDSSVLPEYLAWFLNNSETQKILKAQALGSSMASISKPVLENLEISLPSLNDQERIMTISKLRMKQKDLKIRIERLQEQLVQQLLIKATLK
jgi:restriction endonuclease S subunit